MLLFIYCLDQANCPSSQRKHNNVTKQHRVVSLEAETVVQTPGMKTKSEAEPNFALLLQIAIFH